MPLSFSRFDLELSANHCWEVSRGRKEGLWRGRGILLMIFSTADSSRLLSRGCGEASAIAGWFYKKATDVHLSINWLTTPTFLVLGGWVVCFPAWLWSQTALNCIASASSDYSPLPCFTVSEIHGAVKVGERILCSINTSNYRYAVLRLCLGVGFYYKPTSGCYFRLQEKDEVEFQLSSVCSDMRYLLLQYRST